MKEFGVQLWSIHDEFTDIEKTKNAFLQLGKYGYSYCQTAGTYDYISPEDFRKYADEGGIKIIGTHYSYERIANDIEGTVKYHQILGANDIGIGGYGTPDFESLKRFIDEYNRLGREYAKYGMKLSYHNHYDEFSNQFKGIEGKTKFEYLLEGLDPEVTCFCFDAGWAHFAGCDVYEWLEKLKGRVNIMHIKDIQANYVYDYGNGIVHHGPQTIEIGKGNMNFSGIIKKAEECGVNYVVVEDEFYSTGSPLESVKMSAEYLKNNIVEK